MTFATTSQEPNTEELSLEQLSECNGGFLGLLKAFAEAVIEGAREIETTQKTGTLPNRFWTPITDVSGGECAGGVWNPPTGEGGCDEPSLPF